MVVISFRENQLKAIAGLICRLDIPEDTPENIKFEAIDIFNRIYRALPKRTDKAEVKMFLEIFKKSNKIKDLTVYKRK